MTSVKRTALFDQHVAAGGKMVDFAGWSLPINYGSQIAEHKAVRSASGVFDVSHMTVIDITGSESIDFLRRLLANDVDKLDEPGEALYSVMLNERAGIVDDLIVYLRESGYRMVVNAATRDKVADWLAGVAPRYDVALSERPELAMLAVQGPDAVGIVSKLLGSDEIAPLKPFRSCELGAHFVGRTGYTGEDGVEVILPGDDAAALWDSLLAEGVAPAGLGARDTLRLEAGLNLYGQDMTDSNHPLESNLAWTIDWSDDERDFIGRSALAAIREAGSERKLTGLLLEGKGVIRTGAVVHTSAGEGVVTSGIFSPTLGYSIALARVPRLAKGPCDVELRGKPVAARMQRPPFVRNGQSQID